MKKLFTLVALITCFMGANAKEFIDVEVDFSKYDDISEWNYPYSWGGSESARARISIKDGCLHFESTVATDPGWDCQFFPIGGVDAEIGITYTLHYKVKGDHTGNVTIHGFGQTPWGQFKITDEWVEGSFNYLCIDSDACDLLMQCGDWIGSWDIAYLKITHEKKVTEWTNILVNGDASAKWKNPNGRSGENGYKKVSAWSKEWGYLMEDVPDAPSDCKAIPTPHPSFIEDGVFVCHAKKVNPIMHYLNDTDLGYAQYKAGDEMLDNTWQNQFWINFPRPMKSGEQVKISFRYKASKGVDVNTQYHRAPGDYISSVGNIHFGTTWNTYEKTITAEEGLQSFCFNLTGDNENWKKDIDFYFDDLSISLLLLEGTEVVEPEIMGDVNEDGTVDVADISTIIDIMASKARRQTELEE